MAMASSRKLLLFLSAILILSAQAIAQPNYLYHLCVPLGNYIASSSYATNLNQVLTSVTSNINIDYGFYRSSYGSDSDKVYAIGLCRGDIQPNICRNCLDYSTSNLTQLCPNEKEAIEWFDECMLRYSNRSIFNIMEDAPYFHGWNTQNVSANDLNHFREVRNTLLNGLRSQAAAGGSLFKFATGNAPFNSSQTIYAFVQCTPDLTEQLCNDCLIAALGNLSYCCDERLGGKVDTPNCNLRFEITPFYGPTAYNVPPTSSTVSPPPPPSPPISPPPGNTSRTVIIIVVTIVAFVVLVISIIINLRVRKPKKKLETGDESEAMDEIETVESLQFDFGTIRVATDNFSNANKLGQGGFGVVYKGNLSGGQLIAVKRLSMNSGQGDLEFKNEVLLLAKLQHRSLVRLQGFCLEGNERLLIYEFVPNASLDHFIFDPIKRARLYWEKRYKIIEGIARGLLYLHEDSRLRIIHRDLKASNILLDVEMNPKIADFGMARLFVPDQTQGDTSRIVGTHGYMAPEYIMHGQFSVKSDVFSFGVLLMEIVSGQKNNCFRNGDNEEHLLSYAWKNWREGTPSNLVDPTLTEGLTTEIMQCIHIGLLCVQKDVVNRPTMGSIVLMLSSYSVTLPVPSQPAFYMYSSIESDISQSKSSSSVNEASITDPYPR